MDYWFGSKGIDEADKLFASMLDHVKAVKAEDVTGSCVTDEENPFLSKIGDLAIINVSGCMLGRSVAHWGEYATVFGIVGNLDIQAAATKAANDATIKGVLLCIDSGGGAVKGLVPAYDALVSLAAKKPLVTYAENTLASAALWLACASQQIFVSKITEVGSIGVITSLESCAEANKMEGLDVRVIRSSVAKALGNPNEPITDAAIEDIQGKVDYLGAMFDAAVAKKTGVPAKEVSAKFGEGRTMFSQKAKLLGLVDNIGTLQQAYQQLKKLAKV